MRYVARNRLIRDIAIRTGTDPKVARWNIESAGTKRMINARIGQYRVVVKETTLTQVGFEGGSSPTYDWISG